MKVCFLMYTPFNYGGIERVVSNMSNELIDNGFDVTILCAENKNINYSIYNLNENVQILNCNQISVNQKIIRLRYRLLALINKKTNLFRNNIDILEKAYIKKHKYLYKEVLKKINENNFDYVIGANGYFSLMLSVLKKDLKCKCIGWQHSTYDAYFNTKNQYYYNQEKLYKKYIPDLDEYIVLTNHEKMIIDKKFNINSTVIYNFNSFEHETTSKLDKKQFIAVGRLVRAKGFDNLIKIFSKYSKLNKEWTLKIIGSGKEQKKLKKQIKKYELENRIQIIPFTNDIKKYYLESSIMLISSRWEGFGMTTIEAMEFGLPIISFDIPSIKEIGENNIKLIKKDDFNQYVEEMLKLSNSIDERIKYSELSKKRSELFYKKNVINEWIKLLK